MCRHIVHIIIICVYYETRSFFFFITKQILCIKIRSNNQTTVNIPMYIHYMR